MAEIVGVLLQAGHRLEDVSKYTMIQMQGWISLSRMGRIVEMQEMAMIFRLSYHANGKQWKEFLKVLDDHGAK